MKKWKFALTSLVATASMPLICMVGCGNSDTPVDIEDYKVNEKDFEKIISMLGVQYLQADTKTETIIEGTTITSEGLSSHSPTVYQNISTSKVGSTSSYTESYIYEQTNDPVYYKISRNNPKGSFSSPVLVESSEFKTAEYYGETVLMEHYQWFISKGGELTFDSNDLCYKGEVGVPSSEGYMSLEYHFFKNQLVKNNVQINVGSGDTIIKQSFTYNEITPDVPVPV